jgi:hypothetical protein
MDFSKLVFSTSYHFLLTKFPTKKYKSQPRKVTVIPMKSLFYFHKMMLGYSLNSVFFHKWHRNRYFQKTIIIQKFKTKRTTAVDFYLQLELLLQNIDNSPEKQKHIKYETRYLVVFSSLSHLYKMTN